MKNTKKKLLLTSALVSVCGCFALVACGDDTTIPAPTPTPTPTALDTPTNVSVTVNTLSWSEVSGATNGYTVKINSDETTTVDTTSLDLTTVVTLLSEGDNSLQVKANAAGDKTASAYSAAVTYEYHATVTPTAFEKVTISLSGDVVTWQAVTGATNGYTVKVNTQTADVTTTEVNLLTNTAVNNLLIANSDNSISVKVKAAGDKLESEYSNTVTYEYVVSSDKAAQDFIAAVNAIGTVAADKADAIGLAKTKYNAIKTDEEALAVEGVSDALATLKQKDAQYFAVLVSGIQAVTEDSEVSAFTEFETKYAAALAYYDGLLDNTVAAAQGAKGGLDAAKGNYDNLVNGIKDDVDDLADEIDALLEVDYTQTAPTVAALDALDEKAEAITALKPYAAAYWTENYAVKATDIASKKTEILSIAVAEYSGSYTFITGAGFGAVETNVLTVIYEARNVLNEVIEYAAGNMPTISLTVNGATQTGAMTANANGKYTYTTNWLKSETADEFLSVSYSINGVAATPETYYGVVEGEGESAFYRFDSAATNFESSNGYNAFKDGKAFFTNLTLFFDMYLASDLKVNADNSITITGLPIATHIPVTSEVTTEAMFRSYLAHNYGELVGKTLEVRFVMYRTEDGTADTPRKTTIDHERVSHDPYTLAITEQDLRLDISVQPTDNITPFNWSLKDGENDRIQYAWEILGKDENAAPGWNAENMLWDEVKINIYDTAGIDNVQTHDFTGDTPFAVYTISERNYVTWEKIDQVINTAWQALLPNEKKMEYSFVFAMQAEPNEKGVAQNYTKSALNYATKDGNRETKDYDFRGEFTDSVLATGIWPGSPYNFALVEGDIAGWTNQFNNLVEGVVVTENNVQDYFEIAVEIYDKDTTKTAPLFTTVAPFKNQGYNFNSLMADWLKANVRNEFTDTVTSITKNFTIKLSIQMKSEVNGESNPLASFFTSTRTVPKTANATSNDNHDCQSYTFTKSATMTPTGNQIAFSSTGVMTFAEANQPGARGSIFDDVYGVRYIEVKFTVGGKSYTAYVFKEDVVFEDSFAMNMYASADKTGTPMSFTKVTNGWANPGTFEKFVNDNYTDDFTAERPFTLNKDVAFSTRIVHDGTYFLDELEEFSTAVNYPDLPATTSDN